MPTARIIRHPRGAAPSRAWFGLTLLASSLTAGCSLLLGDLPPNVDTTEAPDADTHPGEGELDAAPEPEEDASEPPIEQIDAADTDAAAPEEAAAPEASSDTGIVLDPTACDGGAQRTMFEDTDGDGYGRDDRVAAGCTGAMGWAEKGGDCLDTNAQVHPDQQADI